MMMPTGVPRGATSYEGTNYKSSVGIMYTVGLEGLDACN